MKLFHENSIFETVKSKVIISLFETVRLPVSISPRNLYNSLKSIKEISFTSYVTLKKTKFEELSHPRGLFFFNIINFNSRSPATVTIMI